MPDIELALRVAGAALLGLVAAVLLVRTAEESGYRPAGFLLLGIGCYLLAPLVLLHWRWGVGAYPVLAMASLVPVFFWYLTGAIFCDGFALPRWAPWLGGATVAIDLLGLCSALEHLTVCAPVAALPLQRLAQLMKICWTAAAFANALGDWRTDLVEQRRRLRLVLVIIGGIYLLVVLVLELIIREHVPAALELLNVSMLFIAASAFGIFLLKPAGENLFTHRSETTAPVIATTSPLTARLQLLMEEGRGYADEGLTIDRMARRLDTQPYRLRQVINKELGYRNFNTFINCHRVREVARRLAEEQYRNTTLLALALDAGFRSLAPFNRSFREEFGTTPSEYRQQLELSEKLQ